MFLLLAEALSDFPLVNAFTYTTTRALLGFLTSFALSLAFGSRVFKWLYLKGYKDYPRAYGQDKVGSKKFTPTMGGILIALTALGSMFLWSDWTSPRVWIVLASVLVFGAVGYLDDTAKKVAQSADGGISRLSKLIPQTLFGAFLGLCAWFNWFDIFPMVDGESFGTAILVPFYKAPFMHLAGILMVLFGAAWSIGISNAVNYTDGLDGMLSVPAFFCFLVLGLYAFVMGNANISEYLLFPFLSGVNELSVLCSIFMGCCLGFLWFNSFPADVFMGDFGSLLLGGVLMTIAFLLHQEVILLISGGIFLFQFFTSAIQDYYFFKFKGQRYFRSAPFHEGLVKSYKMAEAKIVVRYWIVSAILAAFCLVVMKIR